MGIRLVAFAVALAIIIGISAYLFSAAGPASLNTSVDASPGQQAECSVDSDCVPATCCHPSQCVPASMAPDCSGVFCTQECRPGTLDCGQGQCRCMEGKCTAEIAY